MGFRDLHRIHPWKIPWLTIDEWVEFVSIDISPRSINGAEKAILDHILSAEFPGVRELRAQVDTCEVVGLWGQGSVSVDFRVSGSTPRSTIESGPIPVKTSVFGESGELEGEILIWVEDGYLSALEYAWYGDVMPRKLPAVRQVVIDE